MVSIFTKYRTIIFLVSISAVVGIMAFIFTNIFISSLTNWNKPDIEKKEFTGYIFEPYIIYRDSINKEYSVYSDWRNEGAICGDRKCHARHSVELNKQVLFDEFWAQIENGDYVDSMGGNCSWSTVCFSSQNSTAFLVIDFKEDSIKINEQQTIASNPTVISIDNFTGYELQNAKILTLNLESIIEQWNDRKNYSYPSITIWIVVNFTNPCVFANDIDTCESTQVILKELKIIKEKLGIEDE